MDISINRHRRSYLDMFPYMEMVSKVRYALENYQL
jgi:hypothetical protein